MYTTSSSSRRRPRHSASSAFHLSFRRDTVLADNGASSPNSPRSARSKSPSDSPWSYSFGINSETLLVLLTNSGIRLLSNRSSVSRTLGLLTRIVPDDKVSFLAGAYPFR